MLCWVAVRQPYDFSYSFERTRKSNQQHPQKYWCKSLQPVHKVALKIRTLLVHWIYLLSSTYIQLRVIRVEKDWDWRKFPSLDITYSKNPATFNVDSFFWQKSFDIVFVACKKCSCFWIKYQILFFNSYGLKKQQNYCNSSPLIT